jgi:hypothetical protein
MALELDDLKMKQAIECSCLGCLLTIFNKSNVWGIMIYEYLNKWRIDQRIIHDEGKD